MTKRVARKRKARVTLVCDYCYDARITTTRGSAAERRFRRLHNVRIHEVLPKPRGR